MYQDLNVNFIKRIVGPNILYGVHYWLVKNSHIQKIKVAKKRILRWICVAILEDIGLGTRIFGTKCE